MYKVGDVVEIVNDDMIKFTCRLLNAPPLASKGDRGVIQLIDSDDFVALGELDIKPNPNNSDGYVWVETTTIKLVNVEGEPE